MRQFLISIILVFCFCATSFAQDMFGQEPPEQQAVAPVVKVKKTLPKEKQLPKAGSLSTSGSQGFSGGKAVDVPWGTDSVVDGGSPVSGSVYRSGNREWEMKVFNNSKDSYTVSLAVEQFNNRGSRIKSDSFSYRLKPGEAANRRVSAALGSASADLKLNSWKRIKSQAKPNAEGESAPTTDQASTQ